MTVGSVPILGRVFILVEIFFLLIRFVFLLGDRIHIPWNLTGDIHYEDERSQFYFPVVTCIILSLILTVLLNFFLRR